MTAGPGMPHWRESVGWLAAAVREVGSDGSVPRGARALPRGVPEADVAAAAEFHGVAGFARLAASGLHPELNRLTHVAQARHLRALADLEVVSGALAKAGIDVLVVKGPALVATCYGRTDLRSYIDLDVAVRPQQVEPAVRALEGAGCRVLDANWPLLTAQRVHELRVEAPSGGAVDLHWSLGAGDSDTSPQIGTLVSRSVVVASGIKYRTLGPADMLVHVAVHAAASGGHRLVWLADLRACLAAALESTPSSALAACAQEWGAVEALALMLRRAHETIDVSAPRELLGHDHLRVWTGVGRLAERMSPPELVGQRASASRLVARSCRSSPARSLAAAAVKGLQAMRAGRAGPPDPGRLHDWTNPESGLYPVGGPDEAQAFYARVAKDWPG